MKFNCGPSKEEAWRIYLDYVHEWHDYFTWWPTRMTDTQECRWLETVKRRQQEGCIWRWEYKACT